MDDDPDPRLQLLDALRLHSEENAADVAAFDARCLHVAQQCVDLWHRLWLDTSTAVAIDSAPEIKFRICFPLAAHALNHIDIALGLHQQRPWVAASSTRVAFEHALAAQWVLLTDDGERELVNWMKGQHHKRAKELADALTCGVPEVCMAVTWNDGSQPWGIMVIRVPAPALSHVRPGLQPAGLARPVIGFQGRGAARAAA
jgi:hypothetical protein